jgi:hypothetical protein
VKDPSTKIILFIILLINDCRKANINDHSQT